MADFTEFDDVSEMQGFEFADLMDHWDTSIQIRNDDWPYLDPDPGAVEFGRPRLVGDGDVRVAKFSVSVAVGRPERGKWRDETVDMMDHIGDDDGGSESEDDVETDGDGDENEETTSDSDENEEADNDDSTNDQGHETDGKTTFTLSEGPSD